MTSRDLLFAVLVAVTLTASTWGAEAPSPDSTGRPGLALEPPPFTIAMTKDGTVAVGSALVPEPPWTPGEPVPRPRWYECRRPANAGPACEHEPPAVLDRELVACLAAGVPPGRTSWAAGDCRCRLVRGAAVNEPKENEMAEIPLERARRRVSRAVKTGIRAGGMPFID